MTRTLRLLALSFLLAAAPAFSRPALWKVERGPATIYLFGTIHMLPAGYKWRDAKLDQALATSQSLSLEIVADKDPMRIMLAFGKLAKGSGLPPLADRVPPEKRAALAALVAASGMKTEGGLDELKTWAAAVMLTGAAMKQIGLESDSGVEPQLSKVFRDAGKPIGEMETPEQQLGYFDALPEAAQRQFLVQTLDDPAKSRKDFGRMLSAWGKGDTAAIEKTFAEDPEFTPELRALLLRGRDELWADELEKRLEKPGVSFVAVGAGHLVGPDSVQAMLAKKGVKAVRVK